MDLLWTIVGNFEMKISNFFFLCQICNLRPNRFDKTRIQLCVSGKTSNIDLSGWYLLMSNWL